MAIIPNPTLPPGWLPYVAPQLQAPIQQPGFVPTPTGYIEGQSKKVFSKMGISVLNIDGVAAW